MRTDAIPTSEEPLASLHRARGLPRSAWPCSDHKMYAFEMVMQTSFSESGAGRPFLVEYFPHRLQRSSAEHFEEHPLRREIVATAAVNHVINCASVTLLCRRHGGRGGRSATAIAYPDEVDASGASPCASASKDAPPGRAHRAGAEDALAGYDASRDAGRRHRAPRAHPYEARLEPA